MAAGAIIKRIGPSDESVVNDFLRSAGDSLASFRYFDKRPVSVIANHLLTVVLLNDGRPVGYGHLDPADDGTWLGIAISAQSTGKGLGRELMKYMVEFAKRELKGTIKLTVDEDNLRAIGLYERFGFVRKHKINARSFLMELELNK